MKYFLPTYEDCKRLVTIKGELVFYETMHVINGFNVSVFNYRLAQYNDFIEPIKGENIDAKELRGVCFVFNSDGSVFNRYLMLNKFWNINQVPETLLTNLLNKKIKSVYNKEDGSLISFIKLPNGDMITKTKMGFSNDQTDEVDRFKNDSVIKFVNECFDKDYSTLWEYVSYKNKIVLDYKESNLILLRVRNNKTGEYLNVNDFVGKGFDVVKSMDFNNLTDMMLWSETAENVEGVVITFEDDYMVKLKTQWYFNRHQLLTEDANREDTIISMVLNETIDDIRSQLDEKADAERILWIEEIEEVVKNFMIERVNEVDELVSEYNGDIKFFAIKYRNDKNFGMSINVIKGKNTYDVVKEWLLKETNKLEKARSFINRKGFKRK